MKLITCFLFFILLTSCVTPIEIYNTASARHPEEIQDKNTVFSSTHSSLYSNALSSDENQSYQQPETSRTNKKSKQKIWTKTIHSHFFGLATQSNIKAWKKCPSTDWEMIKITRSFGNILIAFFTLGIYTPIKLIITCQSEQQYK